ncbi:MAG: FHA domain-containing protein [Candidatus Wallbacteria bacterium]|nr:FHA domain-containing protein [Candidatus Wallbacteria bacterium]
MRYRCGSCLKQFDFPSLKKGVEALCPGCHGELRETAAGLAVLAWLGAGSEAGTERELENGTTLGRDETCDICLADESVSALHARFFQQADGSFGLSDCDSTNGTRVNGVRVVLKTLRHGDLLRFGRFEATFRMNGGPSPEAAQLTILESEAFSPPVAEYRPAQTTLGEGASELGTEAARTLRLERALEMTAELATHLDAQKLLERLAQDIFELFRTERVAVLLRNPDRRTFSLALARSADGTTPDAFQLSRTVLRKVVGERTAIATTNALMDDRLPATGSLVAAGTLSALVAPLVHRDEVLGLVWTDTLESVRPMGDLELRLFTGLVGVAAVTLVNARLWARVAADARVRAHLSRYLAPEVVQSVLDGKLSLGLGGTLCEATVMFTDIRGFTAASERLEPGQIVELLNRYFERMVDVVFRHGGTVCKFTGDGLMAVWGAPQPHESHALSAVRAGIDMQRAMGPFNAESKALGAPPLEMGVGVHTGSLVAGNIGSSRRMEFTCHGDAVNTAQRIESATGPGDVYLSRKTLELMEGRIPALPLPPIRVKNKADPLELFSVDFQALARSSQT